MSSSASSFVDDRQYADIVCSLIRRVSELETDVADLRRKVDEMSRKTAAEDCGSLFPSWSSYPYTNRVEADEFLREVCADK